MISLLIFAARCATGQLGGQEFGDTTPVVPGVSTTGFTEVITTPPPETEPDTTALAATFEYAEKTAYSTDSVRAKIALLQPIATNIQSPRLQLDTEKYIELRERVDYSELFHYLSDDYKYRYTNEIFIHIAAAREAMKAQNFSEAIKHLSELDDNKTKYKIPAYVLFRLYVDLEGCYKELKNFELAYKYSSKRIALISAFNL